MVVNHCMHESGYFHGYLHVYMLHYMISCYMGMGFKSLDIHEFWKPRVSYYTHVTFKHSCVILM